MQEVSAAIMTRTAKMSVDLCQFGSLALMKYLNFMILNNIYLKKVWHGTC